jgi:hypothetical protein
MDRAKASIADTLAEVKSFLAQETPPRLSEADTKAYFIEPIVRALGWEGIGVVTREYYVRNSQEFIDYLLRGPDGPLIAIEAKTIQTPLTDKHAAQLVQYCAVEGIEWAVLTNGRELHLFNAFLKRDLAAKRVMQLDLIAFNSEDEFASIFSQLWQLSRTQMTTPSGVRTWMHHRRMDTRLREMLVNPGSSIVQQIERTLDDAEIHATALDITQWFRAVLATGPQTILAMPSPGDAPEIEKPITTRPPATSPRSDGEGRLFPLIDAGVLQPNTELRLRRGQETLATAHVDERGRIVVNGQTYRSPSDKAFYTLMGRQSLNGWTHWFAVIGDNLVMIDTLRKQANVPTSEANAG